MKSVSGIGLDPHSTEARHARGVQPPAPQSLRWALDRANRGTPTRSARARRRHAARSCFAQRQHFSAPGQLRRQEPAVRARLYNEQALSLFPSVPAVVAAIQGSAVGGGLGVALSGFPRGASPLSRASSPPPRLGHPSLVRVITDHAVSSLGPSAPWIYQCTPACGCCGEEPTRIGLCDRTVTSDRLARERWACL